MRPLVFTFVLYSLFVFTVTSHHGVVKIEQTQGPGAGGIAFGLGTTPVDPFTVYVDKYASHDAGTSWNKISGFPPDPIHAIAVDARNAQVAYFSVNNVLFKTSDGGKTVQELASLGPRYTTPPWDKRAVVSLAVAPTDSNVVYAGTTHGHLYKSSDAGQTWSELSDRINVNSPVSRIAIHPTNPNVVYVSLGAWYWSSLVGGEKTGGGLYKSVDGGQTFTQIASPEFSTYLVQDVEIAKNDPKTIYVTTRGPGDGSESVPYRVFKSRDNGATWEKILDSQYPPAGARFILGLTHVAVDPNNENTVIVSSSNGVDAVNTDALFFKSLDGGKTWKKIVEPATEPIEYTHDLEILPNGFVYANVYYRPLMRSFDLGEQWEWASSGINHASIHSLFVDPRNRERVFASTSDGALHSTLDGGQTWQRNWLGLHHSTYVYTIRPHPIFSTRLLAGVSGQTDATTGIYYGEPSHETGLYASNNSGVSWRRLNGLPYPTMQDRDVQLEIYDIFIYPENPQLILVGTSGDGIYRSEDGGATWAEANTGIPEERRYWKPRDPGDLDKCQNRNGNKAYCYAFAPQTTMQLVQNPLKKNEIWYLTLNGVFVSRDLGKTWQWLSDDLKSIHTHFMAFDPLDPNSIYMGTHQGAVDERGNIVSSSRGLLMSRDGGKTWAQVKGEGPGEGKDIRAVAIDPANPNTVIAATSFEIYISRDKGVSWQPLAGVGEEILRQVDKLEIDATAKLIYAGTRTSGVWRGILDYADNEPANAIVTGVLAPLQATAGEIFPLYVSVDNLGAQQGSIDVAVQVGNTTLPVRTTSVPSGKAIALEFQAVVPEPGAHAIKINGADFGTVSIDKQLLQNRSPPAPPVQRREAPFKQANSSLPPIEASQGEPRPAQVGGLKAFLQEILNLLSKLLEKIY